MQKDRIEQHVLKYTINIYTYIIKTMKRFVIVLVILGKNNEELRNGTKKLPCSCTIKRSKIQPCKRNIKKLHKWSSMTWSGLVSPSQERCSAGGTHTSCSYMLCQTDTLIRHIINIRGLNSCVSIATDITNA
jgi:hypothetical protein